MVVADLRMGDILTGGEEAVEIVLAPMWAGDYVIRGCYPCGG